MRWFRRKKTGGIVVPQPFAKSILEAEPEGKYKVAIIMPVPELMTGVASEVEGMLTKELGGDYARRIWEVLDSHKWGRCVGGWLPLSKTLNMLEVHACFPHNDVSVMYCAEGMSGPKIADQRNHGVERALDWGADWIWLQDWDVKLPPPTFGVLRSADVDIISATYFMKEHPPRCMAMIPPGLRFFDTWWQKVGQEFAPGERFGPGKIYPGLAVVPNGCLLVKADVFRKLPQPWFTDGSAHLADFSAVGWTDDGYFSFLATEHGYTLHLDTRIMCDHWDLRRGMAYSFDVQKCRPCWRWLTDSDEVCRPFSGEVASLGYQERAEGRTEGQAGGVVGEALDGRQPEQLPE